MRELNDKINQLCIKSKRMRSTALEAKGEKGQILREAQDKVYKEMLFLKNLRTAMNKEKEK